MVERPLAEIFNFLKLSDRIATAGQPTEEQFQTIARSGYQVVVNLAVPESQNAIPHEQALVESQEMRYIHIPVIWNQPTLDDLDRCFTVMNENAETPTFIHCAMNMRVSAFMYLYRRIYNHISDEQAIQDLHKIWIPNNTWQKFIQQAIERYQLHLTNE